MRITRKITAFLLCVLTVFSVLSVSVSAAGKISAPSVAKVTAVTADAARLAWTACKGVSGYRVYRYSDKSWKVIKDTTATSIVISGLKASKDYTFAVKSIKKVNGKYQLSSGYAIAKTKTKDLVATKLSGTAGVDFVSLTWTKVPGASEYEIFVHDGSGWKLANKRIKLYGKVNGLVGDKTYTFAVRALSEGNGKTVKGPVSNYLKLKTGDPNKVTVKCAAVSDSAVKLQWSKANSATGYRVYVYENGSWVNIKDITNANTLTHTVKNLKSDTEYQFRVRAFRKNSSGVTWYQPSTTCKAATNPGIKDVELFRVNNLRDVFASDSYTFSYKISDDSYGFIPVTIAKRGNEYYLRTLVNERPYVLLNKADGASYILLEENESYIKVPVVVSELFDIRKEMEGFIPSEDWDGTASIVTYNSQKVICETYSNLSTGKTIKYFFKLGKLIGIEESGFLGVEETAVVNSIAETSEAYLFDIPDNYQKIFFGTADVIDFAVA